MRKFLIGTMFVTILFRLGDFAFGRPVTFVNFYTAVLFAGLAVFYWLYPPLLEARAQLLVGAGPALLPESGEYRAGMENRL